LGLASFLATFPPFGAVLDVFAAPPLGSGAALVLAIVV
jgi:hypothetical protein